MPPYFFTKEFSVANVEMPNKDSYPSNSKKSRQTEDKHIEPVVQAKVKKKSFGKKLAGSIVSEESSKSGVMDYILYDVLIPAAKSTISDMVTGGIEMLLFGEKRSSNSRVSRNRGTSYVNYNGYSRGDARRDRPRRDSRTRVWSDDIFFDTRGQGEQVIDRMIDMADQFDYVSVADLYSLVGVDSQYTDNNYGWTLNMVTKATIQRTRDGYVLDIPQAIDIRD